MGGGGHLKCGEFMLPLARQYGRGDGLQIMIQLFAGDVIIFLLCGKALLRVLMLEGVLTYVVENHGDHDGRQLVTLTSVFFGPAQKIDKYFIRICSRMKPFNSPRVLHLLWAP